MNQELAKIGQSDELEIAPLGADGQLLKPVVIWSVTVGGDLYVRSYRGTSSKWYQSACNQRKGRVRAGKTSLEVRLVAPENGLHEQIDRAYREKYQRYPSAYVESVTNPAARAATLKIERSESEDENA